MKTGEIIDYLDRQFKPEYQEDYDNAGFLIGDAESNYTGALITLDVTPDTIDEAIDKGLSLIVSHHPLIFKGLKRITNNDATSRMVSKLIKNNISVYAAHTNLDNLDWGVNGILANKIGLTDCHILRPSQASIPDIGAGMVGFLPQPMPIYDFLSLVKARLGIPILRTSHSHIQTFTHSHIQPSVLTVAICGGAGSFLIGDAKRAGADIFLTGDLKYHDFQQADDEMIIADIGHYESEQFSKEIFYSVISEKFSNFACQISEKSGSYINYI